MKIYAEVLEDSALAQFEEAMKQDFVVDGALMPDAHKGYALPIGAVVSTKGVIVPAWVGYDIGCGMCATKLNIKRDDILDHKKEIFDEIYKTIPVGFSVNTYDMETGLDTKYLTDIGKDIANKKKWKRAVGSLGGGNHFIEIGYDENDYVWIIIHSGSRGVGHGIATHYMKLAKELSVKKDHSILDENSKVEFFFKNANWKDKNPEGYAKSLAKYIQSRRDALKADKMLDGHYALKTDSKEGNDYIRDLNWCLDYALANRKEMIERVMDVIQEVVSVRLVSNGLINRNHNHAELVESEVGSVWVHRKGATHADYNMLGVIPGNMRDGSFIVRGLGNPESLCSSSHGAGRVLGRKEANRVLDVDVFKDQMKDVQGKIDADTLDESPDAYKNIFEVMELQKDLVEVMHHIKPMINIKG